MGIRSGYIALANSPNGRDARLMTRSLFAIAVLVFLCASLVNADILVRIRSRLADARSLVFGRY
jgi:hypothetical protein